MFTDTPEAENILRGSIIAIEAIFQTDAPIAVKKALFDKACWLVSERHGKYKTRYWSQDALTALPTAWRHEHVIPRRDLWFVARRTMTVANALNLCEACIVTLGEHELLHQLEGAYGWERYAQAGIPVIDTATMKQIGAEDLIKMSSTYKKAFREARFCGDGEEELEMMKKPFDEADPEN